MILLNSLFSHVRMLLLWTYFAMIMRNSHLLPNMDLHKRGFSKLHGWLAVLKIEVKGLPISNYLTIFEVQNSLTTLWRYVLHKKVREPNPKPNFRPVLNLSPLKHQFIISIIVKCYHLPHTFSDGFLTRGCSQIKLGNFQSHLTTQPPKVMLWQSYK